MNDQHWLRGALLVLAVVIGTPLGVGLGWVGNEAYVEARAHHIDLEPAASSHQQFVTEIRNQSQVVKLQKSSLRYNPVLWVIVGGCLGFVAFTLLGRVILRLFGGSPSDE